MKFLTIAEKLGRPECPYLVRWALNFGFFSIRLHHWLFGDDPRNMHDHSWNFWVLVLKGAYTDVTREGKQRMTPGKTQYRRAEHIHTVDVDPGGCWTLIVTGPTIRQWGFWVKRTNGFFKFKKPNKYFIEHGHHPCK